MPEYKNRSLVVRPAGSVEKTAPGAKRILSGMVADTLALVKKEQPPKRVFRVLTCTGDQDFSEMLQDIIQVQLGNGCVVEVTDGQKATEILELVKQQPFDIIIPLVNNILVPNRVGEDRILGAVDLLTRLKAHYGMPIFALSSFDPSSNLRELLKKGGIDAFFWSPFDPDEFGATLRTLLKISLRETAEQGNAEAQNRFAWEYVDSDKSEHIKWLRRAAEQGQGKAQSRLSIINYFAGYLPEDQRDIVEAYKWTRVRADKPDNDYELINLEEIKKEMTREQIEKGEALAREYLSKASRQRDHEKR